MNDLLEGMIAYAREHNCSDIHLNVGGPAMIRANGVLREYPAFIKDTQTTEMILSMVDERLMEDFKQGKDLDFTYVSKGENRQRVNVYRQQDKLCAAIRIINNTILTLDELLAGYFEAARYGAARSCTGDRTYRQWEIHDAGSCYGLYQ